MTGVRYRPDRCPVWNVLEGSVQKEGNQLRISAQLTKVEDSFNLWSDTYTELWRNYESTEENLMQAGRADPEWMRQNSDLDDLRHEARYQALIERMESYTAAP